MGFTSVDTEIWISPFAFFLSEVSTRLDQTRPDRPNSQVGRAEQKPWVQAAAHSTSPNWRVCRLGPQPWRPGLRRGSGIAGPPADRWVGAIDASHCPKRANLTIWRTRGPMRPAKGSFALSPWLRLR